MVPGLHEAMKCLALLFAMATSHCFAAEGLVAEQETSTNDSTRRSTIRVVGDKVRLDYGNGSSAIIDTKEKQVVTMYHHDGVAMIEQGDEALLEAAKPVQTGYAPPRMMAKISTEKFGGYECGVSDWQWGNFHTAIWVAEKYPHADQFAKYADVLGRFHCYCLPGLAHAGMPLKTISGNTDTAKTVTLIAARIENIADEVFEIPKNAKPRKDR
jgi:hypothetical protein